MKIHILSDLHLEFDGNTLRDYEPPEADVVVLAGDINVGVQGIMWAADTFVSGYGIPVIYVAGNHEFYHNNRFFSNHYDKMRRKAKEFGIHFLQNDTVVIDGVRFVGATLWTDFNLRGNAPMAMITAQMNMNDYQNIRSDPPEGQEWSNRPLTPSAVLAEHNMSMEFLADELGKDHDGPTVVVTHHAPSEMSSGSRYLDDVDQPSYASRLEGFIGVMKPDLWVHGHMHDSNDYMIYDTRIVANPRGYHPFALNPAFDPKLVVEV